MYVRSQFVFKFGSLLAKIMDSRGDEPSGKRCRWTVVGMSPSGKLCRWTKVADRGTQVPVEDASSSAGSVATMKKASDD